MGRILRFLGGFRSILGCASCLLFALALADTTAAQSAPASKASSPGKSVHVASSSTTLKDAKAKIVGTWARLNEDGQVPKDEKGRLIGSILSFDADNRVTFRVDTNSVARYVMTNPDMSYHIEKDGTSGLLVLSGDLELKFAIVSIGADKLSIRYIDSGGKPEDSVVKWERISNDPISPH